MPFLFGIVGFFLGAGLLYLLQQRQLANAQQRLERLQKALEQTEALNKQQSAELKQFQETKSQTEELEQYYQTKLQELEQSYQARLQELEQSPMASTEPASLGEALQRTEAYWEEIDEDEPESDLINPFMGEESEKQRESAETIASEFDLAELLESEDDQVLGLAWPSELPEPGQEQHPQPELDLFETLSSDTTMVTHLPEISKNDSEDDNTLPDLFSEQESSSKELQEFLDLPESKS